MQERYKSLEIEFKKDFVGSYPERQDILRGPMNGLIWLSLGFGSSTEKETVV